MSYKNILFECEDKIGILILNRPDKRNALSVEMREEIIKCLSEIEKSEEVNVFRLITDYGAKDKPRLCGKVKTIRITIFG